MSSGKTYESDESDDMIECPVEGCGANVFSNRELEKHYRLYPEGMPLSLHHRALMHTSHLYTDDAWKVYQSRLAELQTEQEMQGVRSTKTPSEFKKEERAVDHAELKRHSVSDIIASIADKAKENTVACYAENQLHTEITLFEDELHSDNSNNDIEMDPVTDDSEVAEVDPVKKKKELHRSILNMKEKLLNLAKTTKNFTRPIGIKLLDVPPEIPSYKKENVRILEEKNVDPIAALARPTRLPPQHEAWNMKKTTISFFNILCPVDGCGYKFYSDSGRQRHCDRYSPKHLLYNEHMKFASWSILLQQSNHSSKKSNTNVFKLDPPPQPLSEAARASYKIKCEVPGCNYMFFSSSSLNEHYRLYSPAYINYELHQDLYKAKIDEDDSRDDEQIIKTIAKSTPLSNGSIVPLKRRIVPPPQNLSSKTLSNYKYHCKVKGCTYKFGSKMGRVKHYYHYSSSWRLFEEHRRIVEQYVSPDTSYLVNPAIVSTTPQIFHDGDFRMVQLVNGDIIVAEVLSEHGDARKNFSSTTVLFQDGIDIKLVKCKTPEGNLVFAFDPPAIVGWATTKDTNQLIGLI